MQKSTQFNYSISRQNCYFKLFLRALLIKNLRTKSELILFHVCKKLKLQNKHQSINLLISSAIDNIKPFLEIRNVRISGMTRQVPSILDETRQINLAIRWIVNEANKRKRKTSSSFSDALYLEIVDGLKKRGVVKQKTEELHKIAVLNRAFAHYRWW